MADGNFSPIGFRTYARAIRLDPDHALREFQALYPDPDAATDVAQALVQAHGLNDSAARRPPTRLRCLIRFGRQRPSGPSSAAEPEGPDWHARAGPRASGCRSSRVH